MKGLHPPLLAHHSLDGFFVDIDRIVQTAQEQVDSPQLLVRYCLGAVLQSILVVLHCLCRCKHTHTRTIPMSVWRTGREYLVIVLEVETAHALVMKHLLQK